MPHLITQHAYIKYTVSILIDVEKKSIEIKRVNKFKSVQFDNTSRKGDYIRSAFISAADED